jgi:PIN domain nuclease of toxin-antitoxin system
LELPITWRHAARSRPLALNDHRDAFDRMLVAHAITEPLRLLTTDKALAAYATLRFCGGICAPQSPNVTGR